MPLYRTTPAKSKFVGYEVKVFISNPISFESTIFDTYSFPTVEKLKEFRDKILSNSREAMDELGVSRTSEFDSISITEHTVNGEVYNVAFHSESFAQGQGYNEIAKT